MLSFLEADNVSEDARVEIRVGVSAYDWVNDDQTAVDDGIGQHVYPRADMTPNKHKCTRIASVASTPQHLKAAIKGLLTPQFWWLDSS